MAENKEPQETNKTKKYTIDVSELSSVQNEPSNNGGQTETTGEEDKIKTEPSKIESIEINPNVKKRGRPKKGTITEPSKENYNEYSQTELKKDINNLNPVNTAINPNTTTPPPQPQSPAIDMSKFITGALLLVVMDAVLPTLLLKVATVIDPKYKNVNKKLLKLDNDEKKSLEPLANELIKTLFVNINPVTAFFVCSTIIYGSKLIDLDESDFNNNNNNNNKK